MEKPTNFKHIIRVANSDLQGNKKLLFALRKIKGVDVMLANAACTVSNIPKDKKAGELSETEVAKLTDIIQNPHKYNLPEWLFNRRKDFDTGEDKHIIGADINFVKDQDLKKMKMTKSYKGLRHAVGLPVRGQKTKNNFRKSKSKGKGGSLGVTKKKGKSGRV